jgi:hypothetical protein
MAIECFGKLAGKPFLGDVVPVGFVHRASGNPRACSGSPWTVGTLLARRRIIAFQNALDHEPDALRAALVAKEKRLLTIADQNESIVGNVRSGFRGHFEDAPSTVVSMNALIRRPAIRQGLIELDREEPCRIRSGILQILPKHQWT